MQPELLRQMATPISQHQPSIYVLDPEGQVFPCIHPGQCEEIHSFDSFPSWTVMEILSYSVYQVPDWCHDSDGSVVAISYRAHIPTCFGETIPTVTGNTLIIPQNYEYSLIQEIPCCLAIGDDPAELLLYRV